ncbi:MAG: family 78 glycoside hydrolase catalytic domain [Clostridiales bacterium]|nr:family 78 glycoside hydrolase catalytic domain [Clostridiales bacterium]
MLGKKAKALLAAVLTGALTVGVTALPAAGDTQAADTGLRVYDLRCEYLENPEAVDEAAPLLSWKLDAAVRDIQQTDYQILVSTSEAKLAAGDYDAWDSGKVKSDRTTAIAYEGKFEAAADYYWKVKAWDSQGGAAESETAKFGAGLLTAEDWAGASWITSDKANAQVSAPTEETVADYDLEYVFKVDNWAGGVIFGAKDKRNFNMWQIGINDTNGQKVTLNPHVWTDGGPRQVASVDVSSVIPWDQRSEAHKMRIEVRGATVTTFINDTQVDRRDVPVPNFGLIGLRHGTGDGKTAEKSSLDYIKATDTSGKVLFSEDFSDPNKVRFQLGAADTISDGWIHATNQGGADVIWQKTADDEIDPSSVQNYQVEWNFTMTKGAAGFIFGAKDKSNFLMWQFNEVAMQSQQKMVLRPHAWNGGNPSSLGDVDVSSAVAWADRYKPHVMRVEVTGKHIDTYIDDKKVDSRDVSLSGYGMLGFRHHGNAQESCTVDSIRATASDGTVLFQNDFDDPMDMTFSGGEIADGKLIVSHSQGELCWESSVTTSMMRKTFDAADKEIVRAKIFSSALGVYEMYVNGQRVGDEYFAPGWTDYNIRVQYQGYDVTDLVKKGGKNVWGVLAAPGWFSGKIGLTGQTYSSGTGFIGRMIIDYADGTSETVITDESWKFGDPFVLGGDIIDGETYDASKELGGSDSGFATVQVSDESWKNAYIRHKKSTGRNLVAQIDPPVRITEELPAKRVWEKDGRILIDFGQNIAGSIRVKVKAAAGSKLRFRYGEALRADGTLDTQNLRAAKVTDYYVVGGAGEGVYQPRFTFHGFRYAEITGLDIANLTAADVTALAMSSDLTMTGSYESSNEMVNQLYSNILWSQRDNYLSIPTDCPQRDERRGWTGDAQVFVRAGSYNMDSVAFYRKFLFDLRDAQNKQGAYPDVAPTIGFGNFGNGQWADAGVICPWTIYRQYGDVRTLLENYESMRKYMDFCATKHNGYIMSHGIYGDWLCVIEDTPKELVQTSYYGYVASLMEQIAQTLFQETGERFYLTHSKEYAALFEQIKTAFNNRFVSADGKIGNGSQAGYVLALAFGLLDEDKCQAAADKLVENIQRRGNHLTTGFTSISRLCPTLSKYGYEDVAYTLLTNKTYPSWGYSIERGATTIWERWDSCLPDGTIDYSGDKGGMNSLNHYSFGSVSEWMFTNSLGIELDSAQAGFKTFVLQPEPYKNREIDISYAKGSYDSIRGTISSDWSFDKNGKLVYKATVPANTTATLYLPVEETDTVYEGKTLAKDAEGVAFVKYEDGKAIYTLKSGSYRFALAPAETVTDRVTVSADVTVAVQGKTTQLTAKVLGDGASQKVKWTVSGGKAGTSIDQNGLLTVAADETAKTLTVTAAAADDPSVTGSLQLSVRPQGDLDGNGAVTIQDVMEACKILARKSAGKTPTADELAVSDLDGNKDVSINDVMEICKILARQA